MVWLLLALVLLMTAAAAIAYAIIQYRDDLADAAEFAFVDAALAAPPRRRSSAVRLSLAPLILPTATLAARWWEAFHHRQPVEGPLERRARLAGVELPVGFQAPAEIVPDLLGDDGVLLPPRPVA